MPYKIRKSGRGYKVCSPSRCFSKKPMSYSMARRQQQAIYANARSGGADSEEERELELKEDIKEKEKELDELESDIEEEKAEEPIVKEEETLRAQLDLLQTMRKKHHQEAEEMERKKQLMKEIKKEKEEIRELKELKKPKEDKEKSPIIRGVKSIGKLVHGFLDFMDHSVEKTFKSLSKIGSGPQKKHKKETKAVQQVEKFEQHVSVPLYDVLVKNLYDKLGWMLLAKKMGKFEEVQAYKEEIEDALQSMQDVSKILHVKEKEKLNVHYQRLLILYEEALLLL